MRPLRSYFPWSWEVVKSGNFSLSGMRSRWTARSGIYFWPPQGLTSCAASRYPRLVPDLEWICDKAHKVEGARNDALHSPLWGSQRGPGSTLVMPAAGLGHVRAQKLLAKDLLTDFNWCRDASLILTRFARELDAAMSDFGLVWPDRPAWRDRPTPPPRQSAPKAKPTRPPRSSPASGT